MTKVGSRALKNRLGKYLAIARRGERVVVTRRGKPELQISLLPPEPESSRPLDEILRDLEAQGHLRLGTQKFRPFKPIKVKGKPLSRMIIEDRK